MLRILRGDFLIERHWELHIQYALCLVMYLVEWHRTKTQTHDSSYRSVFKRIPTYPKPALFIQKEKQGLEMTLGPICDWNLSNPASLPAPFRPGWHLCHTVHPSTPLSPQLVAKVKTIKETGAFEPRPCWALSLLSCQALRIDQWNSKTGYALNSSPE